MSREKFEDAEGYVRHCWECAYSYDWSKWCGWCSISEKPVSKYDSPSNPANPAGGCIHYRYLNKPEPMTNDEQRYRRVCELLEEALQLMSEWKENE